VILLHHHEPAAAVSLHCHAVVLLLLVQLVRVLQVTHLKLHCFSTKVLLLLLQAWGEPRLKLDVCVVHECGGWGCQFTCGLLR
jgi:hypothetical protein